MFIIGDPKDIAQTYMELAESKSPEGESYPSTPLQEQSEAELRETLTYHYIALKYAGRDGQTAAVIDILTEGYDKAFVALVEASDDFGPAVINGKVQFPLGPKYRKKYYILAGGTR